MDDADEEETDTIDNAEWTAMQAELDSGFASMSLSTPRASAPPSASSPRPKQIAHVSQLRPGRAQGVRLPARRLQAPPPDARAPPQPRPRGRACRSSSPARATAPCASGTIVLIRHDWTSCPWGGLPCGYHRGFHAASKGSS